ncbi:MAG: hypothetical protein JXB07_08555 [Anaerolineae bacterium]|nr:hypothetical protein [Anaerolineae bacterium]
MLFDGFTVFAQIVNFLILLFLLRRFLYRPVLNAMQERERHIAEQLEQADQKHQQAEEEYQRYQAQNQELHEYYVQKQRQAEEEVEIWRKEALQTAHQEVDATLHNWRQSIALEKDDFAAGLRQFAVQQTYVIARRALRDLADADFEKRMVAVFLSRLKQNQIDLTQLEQGYSETIDVVLTLRSAFELSPALQEQIRRELQTHLVKNITLRYEIVPNLNAGIELVGQNGSQVAWNLRRYLEALEDELDEQIQEPVDKQKGRMEA